MSSQIIIISFGPSQLLSQIALVSQLGRLQDLAGIVSYVARHERIIDFDKKVCEVFKIDYLGEISGFREKIKELSSADLGSLLQTVFKRNLVDRLRNWLIENCLPARCLECDLVIAYRANIVADRFLLHAMKPKEVFLVADGFYMTMNNNLKYRIISCLLGGKDYFSKYPKNLFVPDFYAEPESFDNQKVLKLSALNWCYREVAKSYSELEYDFSENPIVLVLWQNLFPQFVNNKAAFIDFYQKLLRLEDKRTELLIVVKPHPRSSQTEIDELIDNCPEELSGKVTILRDEEMLALPVEVFLAYCEVARVVGMASTGIWTAAKQSGADIALYSSSSFSTRLQKEIERFSVSVSTPVEVL